MKVPEIDFESVSTMRAKELHALIKSTNTMSKRMKVSAIETIESIKSEEKQAREDLKAQEKKNRDELKETFREGPRGGVHPVQGDSGPPKAAP